MKYVFLLNMGGVNKLSECDLFLKNMFSDPNILDIKYKILRKLVGFIIRKLRIKAMKENYQRIGGKSPLTQIQKSLCEKLNSMQDDYRFDFISTYVPPFASEVLSKYTFNECDEVILFPLYPHHSNTTTQAALEDFYKTFNGVCYVKKIDYFYQDPKYNKIIINEIKKHKGLDILIISAHSLPKKIIDKGDVYEKHINEHFEILKNELKDDFLEIILAYQSKIGPVKWLEPSLKEILEKKKTQSVLIYPLSFCIDCSETVFELDIEYRAGHIGDFSLCTCPNDKEDFCSFLLDTVKNQAK